MTPSPGVRLRLVGGLEFALALGVAACGPGREDAGAVQAAAVAAGTVFARAPSIRELDRARVRLPVLGDSAVTLLAGVSDDPERRRYVLRVGGFDAEGDFDGDGRRERAVLVTANTGGSGVFVHVVAYGSGSLGAEQEAVLELGDRVQLNRFEAEGDTLLLDVTEHGPDDPLCCPTRRTTRRYRIADHHWQELVSAN